jgi:hypothetical protein
VPGRVTLLSGCHPVSGSLVAARHVASVSDLRRDKEALRERLQVSADSPRQAAPGTDAARPSPACRTDRRVLELPDLPITCPEAAECTHRDHGDDGEGVHVGGRAVATIMMATIAVKTSGTAAIHHRPQHLCGPTDNDRQHRCTHGSDSRPSRHRGTRVVPVNPRRRRTETSAPDSTSRGTRAAPGSCPRP